ncbi:protein bric-a-brac 2-like isoform X4 [Penaeus monodon]|uniref:protein bric-a-brac 2-like isoform X4 n=1 Tax=Penaeus monodon TaxID=6687 RepID=UPI0018A77E4B|nr:protein bric-a-brac 2-like isoform X4 [Penaeus monodon]
MVGRSKVWRLAKFADGGRSEVQCSLCPSRIKYVGNTTNIARHLELKHPLEFASLDPSHAAAAASALARHEQLQQRQQTQHQAHQREEAAICRILAQHRAELSRQADQEGDTQAVTTVTLTPAQLWAWHTPVAGLPGTEERGAGEFGQGGEDMPVSLSPEQFLSEASEREPTPAPPTPTPPKPESYQLRHNNHLTIVLEALARDEAFMDVTLTAQGRSLKAHKSVLSAVSPYFRGVLRDNPCQHPIIIMPRDVRFEELYSIVNYIYKGEMTVAAEDLTSLLKTAEILQVSGLAPSDSTATVNPSTESCATGNVRSSSASSSSSSSTHPPGARTVRPPKATPQGVATPPARPKSRDCMINPTDFMDVDMTCVKEEVASGGEEEEDSANNEVAIPPPANENGKQDEPQETRNSSPTIEHVQETTPTVPVSQVQEPTTTAATPTIKSEPGGSVDHPPASIAPEDPIPFMCPHCQEIHRSNEMIMSHLRLKHPSKPSFVCGCGRVFVRQLQHQAHTRVCSSSS